MICWGLNRGFTQWVFGVPCHDQWLTPSVFVKCVPGLFDLPVFMGWFPGRPFSHKYGRETFFDGNEAIQQGHDPGYLIPHISIPFNNFLLAVHPLTSKHKVEIPVTSVLIEGKFMGTYLHWFLGLICSQPTSLPTGFGLPFASTVIHEMTLEDLILGLVFIFVDMLVDAIWSLIVKGDKWPKPISFFNRFSVGFPKWYSSMLKGIFDSSLVENVLGKVGGAVAPKVGVDLLRSAAPLVLSQMASKVVDHFGKSWLFSPAFSGTVFQGTEFFDGLPRSALPSISVGRAQVQWSFFPKFGWRVGNVTN
jgi:hypothetical protein